MPFEILQRRVQPDRAPKRVYWPHRTCPALVKSATWASSTGDSAAFWAIRKSRSTCCSRVGGTVRMRADCPSVVASTWLRLGPSESRVDRWRRSGTAESPATPAARPASAPAMVATVDRAASRGLFRPAPGQSSRRRRVIAVVESQRPVAARWPAVSPARQVALQLARSSPAVRGRRAPRACSPTGRLDAGAGTV